MDHTGYAIIGGGIAGASIAYHLSGRSDRTVTIFERAAPASETTSRSLAMFGLYGDETQYRMKRYGMALYNDFFADPKGDDLRYTFGGRLSVATSKQGARRFRRVLSGGEETDLAILGTDLDRGQYRYIPGEDLKRTFMMPEIDTEVIEGALYRATAGYMNDPRALAHEFLERAKENGVSVRTNTRVVDVETSGGEVAEVVTDSGRVTVDEVVCAAGPWNVKTAEMVGLEIPVRHIRTPVFEIESETTAGYTQPTVEHYESDFHFYRRYHDRYELVYWPPEYESAAVYDPDELDDSIPDEMRDDAIDVLELLSPSLADAEINDERICTISATPDGNPIVGWTAVDGFSIAAFHTSGIQLAPAVGRMIAEQLVDGNPTSYYDALSISRFEGMTDSQG